MSKLNKKPSKFGTLMKKEGTTTLLSSLFCAVLGLFIGFIILLIISPSNAGLGFLQILRGFAWSNRYPNENIVELGNTLVKTVPLLLCGLSVLFSYKSGLFNIGAAGQYCFGTCFCLYFALKFNLNWFVCILIAMAFAGLLGALNGFLKAFFNVNEVIAGIMLNWIALYITEIVLKSDISVWYSTTGETVRLSKGATNAILPQIGLDNVFAGNKYVSIAIPIAIVVALIVWLVFKKTNFGYELKATGNNKHAAFYAGMKAKKNIIVTMAISGALAGLGAALYYLTDFAPYVSSKTVPQMGFDGIAVAFLGALNPIGTIFASFFIQHITVGGSFINVFLSSNVYYPEIANLIVSIIIYLCAFALFFKHIIKAIGKKKIENEEKEKEESSKTFIGQPVVTSPPIEETSKQIEIPIVEDNVIVKKEKPKIESKFVIVPKTKVVVDKNKRIVRKDTTIKSKTKIEKKTVTKKAETKKTNFKKVVEDKTTKKTAKKVPVNKTIKKAPKNKAMKKTSENKAVNKTVKKTANKTPVKNTSKKGGKE